MCPSVRCPIQRSDAVRDLKPVVLFFVCARRRRSWPSRRVRNSDEYRIKNSVPVRADVNNVFALAGSGVRSGPTCFFLL